MSPPDKYARQRILALTLFLIVLISANIGLSIGYLLWGRS